MAVQTLQASEFFVKAVENLWRAYTQMLYLASSATARQLKGRRAKQTSSGSQK